MSIREKVHDTVYVASEAELKKVCSRLNEQTRLAFDSEFIRTDTFFPKAGLFQLDDGEITYLIDPVPIYQWKDFSNLISNPAITWIMHSSGEDLGLLRNFLQTLPHRLFDTQRAAAFCGLGFSLSYQALVKQELGVELPKGETRSDWLRRPLANSQLEYAELDVLYLVELENLLSKRLHERGMLEWLLEDCRDMLSSVTDETSSTVWESAYKNISGVAKLNEVQLGIVQKLAYWREMLARKRDKPRNWIVRDQELLELARRLPDIDQFTASDIEGAEVFSNRFARREGQGIADFINADHQFVVPASVDLIANTMDSTRTRNLKALQQLTREVADKLDISPEVLATKRLWSELLDNWYRHKELLWPRGFNSWRRELLADSVMNILATVKTAKT